MPSAKTLRVLANPWLHLDHEGLPAGACACDPDEHTPERKFVGATLKAELLRKAEPRKGITAKHRITFAFSEDVQEVPDTAYYRLACKSGELIAADEATAKACGFKAGEFKDPKAVLAEEKRAACERFKAEHDGEAPPFASQAAAPAAQPTKPAKSAAKDGDK